MNFNDINFTDDALTAAEVDTANPYLANPAKGLQLITSLIAHPPPPRPRDQQKHLAHLHQLIHHDFVSLAARDDYPAEAQAFRELQAVEESLEDLTLFPDLANKNIVGLGGGFSAGKSRFLNTLLGVSLLPESVDPTTSIPTYLTEGGESIVALNVFNHQVELDVDALQAISHAFHKHYQQSLGDQVGFAHVLKLLMIHRPAFRWSNLAFLDTPGYSKSEGENSGSTDKKVALKQLSEADHLIWLLDAKNGSLQGSDLDFLRELNHQKPVFFVLTKAEFHNDKALRAIMESTRLSIEAAGIACAGLMAWEAPLAVQVGKRTAGDDILTWLNRLNAAPKYTNKRRACALVLDKYIWHNTNALENNRALLGAMNELLLLAAELPPKRKSTISDQISRLKNEQRRLPALIQEFSTLKDEMLDTILKIVGKEARDEDVKQGPELVCTFKRKWLARPVQAGETFEARISSVRSEVKKVFILVDDGVVELWLPFSLIRSEWGIDPLTLTQGNPLSAQVRRQDEVDVDLAIINPNVQSMLSVAAMKKIKK